jgi:hypothetical protein
MEVISIDGTEYVKASQLARQFAYTADYIGQLCRGGKVDAKLVGRTWYVSQASLETHKTGRYVKGSSNDKANESGFKQVVSRKEVEAVVRRDTRKSAARSQEAQPKFLKRIEWRPVKYEADESELLPPIKAIHQQLSVPVALADARNVKIHESSERTKLTAEPLPEVSLSGNLAVRGIDDIFEANDNSVNNIDISEDELPVPVKIKASNGEKKVSLPRVGTLKNLLKKSVPGSHDPYTYDVPVVAKEAIDFSPQSTRVTRESAASEGSLKPSLSKVVALVASILVCVGVSVGAVLFVEFNVVGTQTSFLSSLVLASEWPW